MKSCDIPVLVVGNKSDAEKLVPDDKIESIQEEWGCKYLGKWWCPVYCLATTENLPLY